ncbi:MAG TPA: c-type cytochrome [Bryobacteraceae bacterium]|nr:c-type cytochrome [Bryobacteraceae bacterium]
MRKMFYCGFLIAGAAMLLLHGAESNSAEVERGKYLVEDVGKCGDCHTPMTDKGPDKSQWLKGAMLPFAPSPHPIPHWKAMSPDITGDGSVFKQRGEEAITKFLETAVWPDGDRADPPMPEYHLKPADARAVVAYLKTLK